MIIADQLIVDNDSKHPAVEVSGEIALKAGFHKIKLEYFQAGGGKALKVFISSYKIKKEEITATILSH